MVSDWEIVRTKYYLESCKKLAKKLFGKRKQDYQKLDDDLRAAELRIRKNPLKLGDLHHDSGTICPDDCLLKKYRQKSANLKFGSRSAYRILAIINCKSHKIYLFMVYWKKFIDNIEKDELKRLFDEFF